MSQNKSSKGEKRMNTFTTKDGTSIFYKDWGGGPVVTFSHGWPLASDAWDAQMLFLGQKGYRVVAHDRRGHGRSGQTWQGNNMDQYADDLAELMNHLDLHNVTMVGHSTGGGEVVRYIARHGQKRVAKVVLISAVPPLMLKTEKNPGGLPLSVFDEIRAGVVNDRSQFFKDLSLPFYGYNKPGAKASEGVRDEFWLLGMQSSVIAAYDCIKAFSETDQTEDLKRIEVPTLVIQGDADQIVPIDDSGRLSVKLVKNGTLKVIPGAPHGLCTTHADVVNQELLAFLQE
jgi:non-heme chloroperoxidase